MRTTLLTTGVFAVLSALLWGSGCGGNVVIDRGAGGAGGAGGNPGGTSSGPMSSSASSGGGDPAALCSTVCAQLAANRCPSQSLDQCVGSCQMAFGTAGPCAPALTAYVQCVQAALGSGCDSPPGCSDLQRQYEQCTRGGGCGPVGCAGGSDGGCACKGSCRDRALAVECTPQGATNRCTCFVDGNQVGVCEGARDACNFETGCCAPFFAGSWL